MLPYVIWALDLVINAMDFYESNNYLLFLSQKAKDNYPIKLVGEKFITNDC